MTNHAGSTLVKHAQCPKCAEKGHDTSKDNLGVYDDGHSFCFKCKHYILPEGSELVKKTAKVKIPEGKRKRYIGQVQAISSRRLTKATCQKWNYRKVKVEGKLCELGEYVRNGTLIAQKIRKPRKRFALVWVDEKQDLPLFGQHLWKPGGKRLIITEGEHDAMSISQLQDNRWPVVSVPNGSTGAAKVVANELEYIESFETVVFAFDMDEAGEEAAQECAALLTPGKAHIAKYPLNDANEHLKEGMTGELMQALWEAEPYRPDGVIHVTNVDMDEDAVDEVWAYPWKGMTTALYGRRSGELIVHTSGSGMGKTTVLQAMQLDDLEKDEAVGALMLEQSPQDTIHNLMSLKLKKQVRQILAARKINDKLATKGIDAIDFGIVDDLSREEYDEAYGYFCKLPLYMYDHFGSLNSDTLLGKMNHMVQSLGCKKIYLDHISIVISGMESGNERKDIDILMTKLRQFVEHTGCHVDAVCHLIKPQGKSHEEGGQISLKDLRGSGALYQLADGVIGYERNQQHPDEKVAHTIAVRSLKDRFSGKTGVVAALKYDKQTSELTEIDFHYDDEGNLQFRFDADTVVPYTEVRPDLKEEESKSFFDDDE